MDRIPEEVLNNRLGTEGTAEPWSIELLQAYLEQEGAATSKRTVEHRVIEKGLLPPPISLADLVDENASPVRRHAAEALLQQVGRERTVSLFVQMHRTPSGKQLLAANDGRRARSWVFLNASHPQDDELIDALNTLCGDAGDRYLIWPHTDLCGRLRCLADADCRIAGKLSTALAVYPPSYGATAAMVRQPAANRAPAFSHLDRLEAESIHIMREVAATAEKPVMLYSVGKDSSVMLHLARKAFHPSPPPFPLLHVDSGWKFQEMYQFRDRMAAEANMRLLTHINREGVERNINPIDHGSSVHTDIMKTQSLKQALDKHAFDTALGGARRDEEKSRAKERIFSFRTATHRWDPKNQRPELWNLYNTAIGSGESIRVFPISNWTELDVWQYIHRENIPIVPLYFAALRPYICRDGMLIMLDDDRLQPREGEKVEFGRIRFRTLGCYPLTGAIESDADDLDSVILELLHARSSERQGRAIDTDAAASMEKKKLEGYF